MKRRFAFPVAVLLVLIAAAALAAGATAGRKTGPQYLVTLSGDVRVEWTESSDFGHPPVELPEYCRVIGGGTETRSLSASVKLSSAPEPIEVSYYGRNFPRLLFLTKVVSRQATASYAVTGQFEPDPQLDPSPKPGDCALDLKPPVPCSYYSSAKLGRGIVFGLAPDPQVNPTAPLERQNQLVLDSPDVAIECGASEPQVEGRLLGEEAAIGTKLRVGRLLSLAKGHALTESGKSTFPPPPTNLGHPQGSETVTWSLKILRVR